MDIVVVLDASYWNRNFANMLSSVGDILNTFRLCPQELRIAIVTFATEASTDLSFYDNADVWVARSTLLTLQQQMTYDHNLNAALLNAEQLFSQARPGAHKVMLVVSSYAASGFEGTADRLRQSGVIIAGYGFDGASSNSAWLQSLVSGPTLSFDSFDFNLDSLSSNYYNNLLAMLTTTPSGK